MPVHRHEHPGSSTVYAYAAEIDEWFRRHEHSLPAGSRPTRWVLAVLAILIALVLVRLPGGKPHPTIRSVLVLPVTGGEDPLGRDINERLAGELSRRTDWLVISHPGGPMPASEAMRKAGTDGVLVTQVTRRGDRIELEIRVMQGSHDRWRASYRLGMREVPAAPARIAREIAHSMAQPLNPPDRKPPTTVPQAYEAYLQGRYLAAGYQAKRLPDAIHFLEKAVEADPHFALAWAVLSERLAWTTWEADLPPPPAAIAAAQKALELDDHLAEAHVNIGDQEFYWKWNWAKGEAAFRRAVELDPGSSDALNHYGLCLSALGRHEEAIRILERARRVEPLSLYPMYISASALHRARRPAEAVECVRAAIVLDPNYPAARELLAALLAESGHYAESVEHWLKAEQLRDAGPQPELHQTFASEGYKAFRARMLETRLRRLERRARAERVSPLRFAVLCAALDRRDDAFRWLEQAYTEHCPQLAWIRARREWDPLRADPRYDAFVARMKFPQ